MSGPRATSNASGFPSCLLIEICPPHSTSSSTSRMQSSRNSAALLVMLPSLSR